MSGSAREYGVPADQPSPPTDRAAERYALGLALRGREQDVLVRCQEACVDRTRASRAEVVSSPLWSILSIAVNAIVDWLTEGKQADEDDRERIASLGSSVASVQVATATSKPGTSRPGGKTFGSSELRDIDTLSMTLVTRLNLWWSKETRAVLTEEARRLRISQETLDEATEMVVRSCNSSMVQMAKQFDAKLATLHQNLSHLALHDPLTGLANRRHFLDRLDRALSRLSRHPGSLAVIFMDLDHFKEVNDIHGHGCGDRILVEATRRMTEQGRRGDLFARMSGDEFVVLMEDLLHPKDDAMALAERVRAALAVPFEFDEKLVTVTVSIGIAVASDPSLNSEQVLARADSALYSVKRIGRNRVATVELGSVA